jgi:glyoxalase family protein
MQKNMVLGLHHVTALSSDARKNLEFYAGILGLRMVKKTVNFDAPEVYHLYYGDREGSPGTLMTFFPYKGLPAGRKGAGQLTVTSFSIPGGSLGYWRKRLDRFGISYSGPGKRFGDEEFIYFEDFDGLGLELVENDGDYREGHIYGHIPREHTIKGFFSITLNESLTGRTGEFLTRLLNHELIHEENGRSRFSPDGEAGGLADIVTSGNAVTGRQGSGTVHHVAFATPNEETQLEIRQRLVSEGIHVTPVVDRQYFKSIYFREPGGVLFEVATLPPGMAVDEDPENLGDGLMLPPWHEKNRRQIEKNLEPLELDAGKFFD